MSLLVSIFDKFENTDLSISGKNEEDIVRLKQKKNFFKRFISITSYLVILLVVHYQTKAILILFIFLLNTKTFTN